MRILDIEEWKQSPCKDFDTFDDKITHIMKTTKAYNRDTVATLLYTQYIKWFRENIDGKVSSFVKKHIEDSINLEPIIKALEKEVQALINISLKTTEMCVDPIFYLFDKTIEKIDLAKLELPKIAEVKGIPTLEYYLHACIDFEASYNEEFKKVFITSKIVIDYSYLLYNTIEDLLEENIIITSKTIDKELNRKSLV